MTKDEIDYAIAELSKRNKIGDLVGDFTWDFGSHFFIETSDGNFIWNNINNVIIEYSGSYDEWLVESDIPYARCKGQHYIKDYCGNDFKFAFKKRFIEYKFRKDGCSDKNEANIDWDEFVNIFYEGNKKAANIEYAIFANEEE